MRTDRQLELFRGDDNAYVETLRRALLTYAFYNFDLGYCQARPLIPLITVIAVITIITIITRKGWLRVAVLEPSLRRDGAGPECGKGL